jgi:hypothetical protein
MSLAEPTGPSGRRSRQNSWVPTAWSARRSQGPPRERRARASGLGLDAEHGSGAGRRLREDAFARARSPPAAGSNGGGRRRSPSTPNRLGAEAACLNGGAQSGVCRRYALIGPAISARRRRRGEPSDPLGSTPWKICRRTSEKEIARRRASRAPTLASGMFGDMPRQGSGLVVFDQLGE